MPVFALRARRSLLAGLMEAGVLGLTREDVDVGRRVVSLVLIYVVCDLTGKQGTSEVFFRDYPMFVAAAALHVPLSGTAAAKRVAVLPSRLGRE